jgi:hypothetical protein
MRRFALGALLIACVWPTVPAWGGGEIYGTISTHRNEEFTGPIRWDLNENFWDDVLDAEKRDTVFVNDERSRVQIFGLSFGDDDGSWLTHPFKIQFGHIASIEPRGGGRVRIELKGGTHIDVNPESTDLGEDMRGLVIFEDGHGVELEWNEVDRIEFSAGPGTGLDEMRLYGTVETAAGDFTGFIVWDRDEALTTDILDGKEDGRKHKIKFGEIREIERRGSNSSKVILKDGERLSLSGSNDVDDDNRGIDITVLDVGLIKVEWEDFDRVVFSDPPKSRAYDNFDGGRRLHGTVRDDHDRTYSGFITWDLDEQFTWEYLDGQVGDVEFEISFENIARIERDSRRSALVKLHNGMVFTLSDSNDVDRDNKGIVVEMDEGDEMEFDWYDFDSVEFSEP